jgi:Response regulator containing a CheY-like receiver domain and an HTH DNA-binding domain
MGIRVLIVEDQRIVREGIVALLEDEEQIEIVGEAANGREAIAMYASLRPDVVLMDLQMPEIDGPEATRQIRAADPQARVLVLTTYATDEFIFTALKAGASGYLLKDTSADQLVAAIKAVQRGETQLSPQIASRLVHGISQGRPEPLSSREIEVLRLVADGLNNIMIAEALSITPRTVKAHVQNILAKLGANNRAEAVRLALQQGIIQ